MVANASKGNWWGATGCWTAYQGGIPGYPNNVCTTGNIRIFVRINNIKVRDYKSYDSLTEASLYER